MMRKLRITYAHSFYSSSIEQCFYCERHLSDHNNWTNLQRCNDLFRPSTKSCGNKITRDHVRPISKHPESRKIVFSCHSCNNSKANDEAEIFLAKLKIANTHNQNYKKIPYHLLSTIIVNLQDLIHKSLRPFARYPALSILQRYDLSLLRQQLHGKNRQLWLDRIDDYTLLELLLLCLGAQNNRSRDGLAHDAAFFNITLWQERLELALEIGWISAFYRIDTIDFHALMEEQEFDQFYILSDRGRAALQLETVCSQQQKK
ncbi:hypothetical protein [Sphingobacterium zeae]|uniref:hypothetical protein n=1 Tax=Sphingobacterium zeae TaxID=1776859 RepID=UPI00360EED21